MAAALKRSSLMAWVRCSDGMPPPRTEVLCCVHSGYDGWGSRRIMFWDGLVWHESGVVHSAGSVTHWCHIPDMPQEEEEHYAEH